MKQYQQCRLRKDGHFQTRWIEKRGAKPEAVVEVLPSKELWTVDVVYARTLPEDQLKKMQLMHRGSFKSIEPIG